MTEEVLDLDALIAEEEERDKEGGIVAVIGGMRLSGKTTLSGTLKGKTLLIYAKGIETSIKSAKKLAKDNGNTLHVVPFGSLAELGNILNASIDKGYDHVYIDSLTAVNNFKYQEPDVNRLVNGKGDAVFKGFRLLGEEMLKFLATCKEVAQSTGINIFLTIGYDPVRDKEGNLIDLNPALKGNMTLSFLQQACPIFLFVGKEHQEDGTTERRIFIKDQGPITARIDYLLEHEGPKKIKADLMEVFKLLEEFKRD